MMLNLCVIFEAQTSFVIPDKENLEFVLSHRHLRKALAHMDAAAPPGFESTEVGTRYDAIYCTRIEECGSRSHECKLHARTRTR